MTPEAELRLLRRLAPQGVLLLRDGPDGWAAYPQGDRRRRALARLSETQARALTASGALSPGDARALTDAGRARLARLRVTTAAGAAAGSAADAHAAQHRDLQRVRAPEAAAEPPGEPAPGALTVNRAESPLARLARTAEAGAFSAAELQAGERLREDLVRSTYNARLTMDWSAPPAGKGAARGAGRDPAGAADGALAARGRVNAALNFVAAPLSSVLLDLLWREIGLDAIERARNWPRRSGRLGVKLALARLAEHYGLAPPPSV